MKYRVYNIQCIVYYSEFGVNVLQGTNLHGKTLEVLAEFWNKNFKFKKKRKKKKHSSIYKKILISITTQK